MWQNLVWDKPATAWEDKAMIALTMKALPVAAMVSGGVANQDEIKAQVEKFTNIAKEVAVQCELDGIAKLIYLDAIDEDYDIPKPGKDFEAFVRKNMKAKRGSERDTAMDFWDNPYELEVDDEGFTVSSAGPDGISGNKDDLISGFDI